MSAPPTGGKPTIHRTGCDGQVCAHNRGKASLGKVPVLQAFFRHRPLKFCVSLRGIAGVRLSPHPYEAAPPSVRARYNFPAPSRGSAEDPDWLNGRVSPLHGEDGDSTPSCTLHFPGSTVPASHPIGKPRRGDGRGFRTIGRPGDRGGLGGRPSPLVACRPDQVQSGSMPEFWFASSGLQGVSSSTCNGTAPRRSNSLTRHPKEASRMSSAITSCGGRS